jgi:hypothetical protein
MKYSSNTSPALESGISLSTSPKESDWRSVPDSEPFARQPLPYQRFYFLFADQAAHQPVREPVVAHLPGKSLAGLQRAVVAVAGQFAGAGRLHGAGAQAGNQQQYGQQGCFFHSAINVPQNSPYYRAGFHPGAPVSRLPGPVPSP